MKVDEIGGTFRYMGERKEWAQNVSQKVSRESST
jgi:hypothetical protein